MLARVSNDFSMLIRKGSCRLSSCASASRRCASDNRHSVLNCRRSPTRPMIALHSCAWQKTSQHSLPACAALLKRLALWNAKESCASWLKRFWSAKTQSPFVTAFRFLRLRPKTEGRSHQTVEITFCVRGVMTPPCGVPFSRGTTIYDFAVLVLRLPELGEGSALILPRPRRLLTLLHDPSVERLKGPDIVRIKLSERIDLLF